MHAYKSSGSLLCVDRRSPLHCSVCAEDDKQHLLWVGPPIGSSTLDYALMACGPTHWSFLDPATDTVSSEAPPAAQKLLMRRRYLVSKAVDSSIVGILVSTVAVDGWKHVLQQIKALAKAAGKKTYTIFLGKPAPEKLANFPEVCSTAASMPRSAVTGSIPRR